jgi:HD superfamily phosphohydrolase
MTKQRIFPVIIFIFLVLFSCRNKNSSSEKFFPVLSFLKAQAAHIDTSMYQLMKLESRDGNWDTAYIKREDFKRYAKDFLGLPDIASKEFSDKYNETKFADESLNRIIITYLPKNKDSEIQREEINIIPDNSGNDKVKTIIINTLASTKDSTVEKRMLWQTDEGFQVTTIIEKQGKPDDTKTLKVSWQ